jgi:DNA-binding ferritin-like protein
MLKSSKTMKFRKNKDARKNKRKSFKSLKLKKDILSINVNSPSFHREVVLTFLNMLNTVKLHHWRTKSYAKHKATDDLYSDLNSNIDKFVEVMLGKSESRVYLNDIKSIPLNDYSDDKDFTLKIESYINYFNQLLKNTDNSNSDLETLRDEILINLNQYLYLNTFN